MAEAALVNLAVKISGYLGDLAVEKVLSWWGVHDDLKQIDGTIRIINSVLLDAEKRQSMGDDGAVSKEWTRRLRKVLYHADDLFDEVITVKHQTSYSLKQGNRLNQLVRKVLLPFSKSSPICFNYYVAEEIKSIRKELDAIKGDLDLTAFNLWVTSRGEPGPSTTHLRNKWETSSSVNPEIIVGREGENNNIIEMLLSEPKPNEGSISVIPIVGMGGIGKTTLAQLVFNDGRVKNHFDLTKWVWLSEKDNKNEVIGRIFRAFIDRDYHDLSLEHLQSSIRASIGDKKYLLVLDNLWDESRDSWLHVLNFLSCSKRGSRIIVTTRSSIVAQNVGSFHNTYEMQLLSDEESWDLFQKVALLGNNPNLIGIGKEIVKKCGNVPLVIRAIGSVLYGKDKEIEWRRFKDFQLARIDQSGTRDVMSLLKLSFDQLPSQLKQCFAYFALLPNHNRFSRDHIICCWMSLGFIKQPTGENSLDPEDVGQRYFRELLSRNFFQDAIPDGMGDIMFRLHDLMKDLAVRVIDDHELVIVDPSFRIDDFKETLNDEIRLLSLHFDNCDSWEPPLSFRNAGQIRYLGLKNWNLGVCVKIPRLENMLSIFISLRSLELRCLMIESVPDAIGQLRHLRLLCIESCPIKCLPSSIKRLWNLQTMVLENCRELKALPASISRLINLRCLQLWGCDLMDLPPNFGKLKSLRNLSHLIVGKNNGLDTLADMNLRGYLKIRYRIWRKDAISEARKANLKEKHFLEVLSLDLGHLENIPHDAVSLLEEFQPPVHLKVLKIGGYQGERLPSWMADGLSIKLLQLVKLTLRSFKICRVLSSEFYQLPYLKHLKLYELPELREWSRVSLEEEDVRHDGEDGSTKATFPCLETLEIYECPQLISMPSAPRLDKLTGEDINVGILALTGFPSMTEMELSLVHGLHSLVVIGMPFLKDLEIKNCRQLSSITVESPTSIKHLKIKKCGQLREIKGLHHLSSCLVHLHIEDCEEMNEFPTNMDCLMSLETLQI